MNRLELLDGLRAVAISLVIITHYANLILPGGGIGVSVFFVLSGFLITTMLLDSDITVKGFLIRRFFRIYPAYLTILIVQFLLSYYTDSKMFHLYTKSMLDLMLFIRMPSEWIGMGVGIFWTIQIEILFYILIPFILRTGLVIKDGEFHVKSAIKIIYCLIFASYAIKGYVSFNLHFSNSFFALLFWMDGLLYGALVACLLTQRSYIKPAQQHVVTQELDLRAKCILIGVALVLLAIAIFVPSEGMIWPIQSSIASAITASLILAFRGGSQLNFHLPKSVTYLATVSYSAYLCHSFPLDYVSLLPQWPRYGKGMLLISVIILATLLLHYLIEKPGIKLGKIAEKYIHRSVS